MYENETYEGILKRMLERVPDKLDKRESSLIWDTQSAAAIELQLLYLELDALIHNSYGDTAEREFLVLLCRDRGIYPYKATKAVLQGEFTPPTIDVAGRRFNLGELNYIVKDRIAPGIYRVECESEGEAGNWYLGNLIPVDYIDGLQGAELTQVLIPGEEEEDAESLRKRYFASFDEKAFGGNREDYLQKVNAVPGVGAAKVMRAWNGGVRPADMIPGEAVAQWYEGVIGSLAEEPAAWLKAVYEAASGKMLTAGGAVRIVLVNSSDFTAASDTLLAAVQKALDPEEEAGEGKGLAPIGHLVSIASAKEAPVTVSARIILKEGSLAEEVKQAAEAAVSGYLAELRREWAGSRRLTVRSSQIETRILGVDGIVDIMDTKINAAAGNLILGEEEVPVMGGMDL